MDKCGNCIRLSECTYEFGARADDPSCTGFREPLRTPHPEGPTMTDKTEAMDLAKTLYELSKAATQGEWISIQSSINPDRHYITNEHHAIFASEIGGTKPADLKFVTSLVNLYRTGKLVVVPDDAVERMARALAVADGIEICSDAIYALSSYGHRATAALAALKGADHAG